MKVTPLLLLLASMLPLFVCAQMSPAGELSIIPNSYLKDYTNRARKITAALKQKSEAAIDQMERSERRLADKLSRKDSTKAAAMKVAIKDRYAAYRRLISDSASIDKLRQLYLPGLDSATVLLRLFSKVGLTDRDHGTLDAMRGELSGLQQGLTRTNMLQQALSERVRDLRSQFDNIGLVSQLSKITKRVAYYKATLSELRTWANEPDRALSKLLTALSQTKLFKGLFERYSMLAALLPPTPGLPIDPIQAGSMQMRSTVLTSLGQTSGITNPARYLSQQSGGVGNPFQELKDKLRALKQDKNLEDPTDNLPNQQRAKSFLKRLEVGSSFQTTRTNDYFPTTSDMGLTLAFRINDQSAFGVGTAYKMGWGKDFRHLKISHEGVSLRSFLNVKVIGAFHATGGWEYHYQKPFADLRSLPDIKTWRQSALLGVTARKSLRNRIMKSTQVQVLIDFLAFKTSYPPVIVRVGYQFTK